MTSLKPHKIRSGKVRDIWHVREDVLGLVHSDRTSSFDRHICDIPGKGALLNLTSAFWFEKTEHIIANHLILARNNVMIAKACTVFPIEVVVRGYITGSTKTSLWTQYSNGIREYCGILFPEGLQRDQKLSSPVVTPTTKGEEDIPLSEKDIVEQKIVSAEDWTFIRTKALELFRFVSDHALSKGLILADTKMEFGKLPDGSIILIDEIFTCDSSRYWIASSYQERFDGGEHPQSLDKDLIRQYVKSRCDPYKDPIPEIPQEKVAAVRQAYIDFYKQVSGSTLEESQLERLEVPSCFGDLL